ncbi:ATP-binding cassette domain-containing protein [Halovivax limisalsi]|uniref:ATP-binding cassette domain-containing protein n=1 Tax=Halovivax limisalsi TaxID=1453760 RepID=UPI001FFD2281|nr:ABC transporter ATP-binding protein [Halovivax limisalsi]
MSNDSTADGPADPDPPIDDRDSARESDRRIGDRERAGPKPPGFEADDPIEATADAADGDAIVLEGVTKRYGTTVALADVTLSTEPGIHGLIGPNGSGKTTLFRLIAGLSNPTSGRIDRPAAVGYSFQEPRFYPELTVRENLAVFRSLDDDPEPRSWVETLCAELRLEPAVHRRAGDVSGGFRKKLDLALALLSRPSVLLLDEPLADVDEFSRRKILDFFADYADDDRTIVVSSHNAAAFEGLYDRVTILLDGELRADGAPDDPRVGKYRRYYG